jgi:hypothetical protein
MVLLDVVWLSLNIKALLKIVMIVPMEDTRQETTQLQRYYSLFFYWRTLFKDCATYVKSCDKCQRVENIGKRNKMAM